nr:MAG TPA: hypothetical protein [Caudoviricetes sp.]
MLSAELFISTFLHFYFRASSAYIFIFKNKDVEHSWVNYIFSSPMLYGGLVFN